MNRPLPHQHPGEKRGADKAGEDAQRDFLRVKVARQGVGQQQKQCADQQRQRQAAQIVVACQHPRQMGYDQTEPADGAADAHGRGGQQGGTHNHQQPLFARVRAHQPRFALAQRQHVNPQQPRALYGRGYTNGQSVVSKYELGSYGVFGFNVGYNWKERISVRAGVNNLFDKTVLRTAGTARTYNERRRSY